VKLLPDDFWPEWEPKPTLVEFGLALAVFTLILLVIFTYYVLFAVAQ
jgi:hypothetical protein